MLPARPPSRAREPREAPTGQPGPTGVLRREQKSHPCAARTCSGHAGRRACGHAGMRARLAGRLPRPVGITHASARREVRPGGRSCRGARLPRVSCLHRIRPRHHHRRRNRHRRTSRCCCRTTTNCCCRRTSHRPRTTNLGRRPTRSGTTRCRRRPRRPAPTSCCRCCSSCCSNCCRCGGRCRLRVRPTSGDVRPPAPRASCGG